MYRFNVVGYTFEHTCFACPEQYDVYWNNKQVAYVRLRHGMLRVYAPDFGDNIIFTTEDVEGDGCFTHDERPNQLRRVVEHIENYYINLPYVNLQQYEFHF
jgi:hypothetical protein